VTWTIDGTPLDIDWANPTLQYVEQRNDSFPTDLNLIKLPKANEVTFRHSFHINLVESANSGKHSTTSGSSSQQGFSPFPIPSIWFVVPLHHYINRVTNTQQHGHDFYVLGTGLGVWNNSFASTLQYTNPPRRDVAMLPAPGGGFGPGGPPPTGGWLVLAFLTDNPGAVRISSLKSKKQNTDFSRVAYALSYCLARGRRSRCAVFGARERDCWPNVAESAGCTLQGLGGICSYCVLSEG
jgi:hypothetical protein